MSSIVRAAALVLTAAVAAVPGGAQQVVSLPERDNLIQPALTDVFKIGKAEGEAWQLYGENVEVAFDAASNLYVFDRANARVVVVSPTGQLVREIGKRGEGPGEIRNAAAFAVLRDGTVVIADLGQRSFLIYNRNGEYQRSVTFATGGVVALGNLAADPRGGSVVSSGQRALMVQSQGGGAPTLPTSRPVQRFGLNAGSQGREIFKGWEPPRPEAPPISVSGGGGGGRATTFALGPSRQRAFEPQLFTALLTDGQIVVSDSSAYALKVLGPEGDLRRVYQRPLRPRPVTESIQQAERERRLAELEAGGGPRIQINAVGPGGAAAQGPSQEQIQQMLRGQIEALEFFPELPVVTGLAAGWTGKIWVGRRGEEISGPGPIDVLGPSGDYLGTIAPDGLRIPNAFGPDGLAAFVEPDALGVVTVAVRRLPAQLR